MRHLSLAAITLKDLPAVSLISAVSSAGYQGISVPVGNSLMPANMRDGVRPYCLVENVPLRREVVKRAHDAGISLDLMEGFIISPIFTMAACGRAMDAAEDAWGSSVSMR